MELEQLENYLDRAGDDSVFILLTSGDLGVVTVRPNLAGDLVVRVPGKDPVRINCQDLRDTQCAWLLSEKVSNAVAGERGSRCSAWVPFYRSMIELYIGMEFARRYGGLLEG